jgi:hypothetical protein
MPPAYVKPYVKRQKNDAADAEEAVSRANTRFVATKSPEQQGCLMLHRTRHLFIRQQTAVINANPAHLAEFGVVAPVGRRGVEELLDVVADSNEKRVPEVARACVGALGAQLRMLKAQVLAFDRQIMAWHRSNETSKRLDEIPGVGPALSLSLGSGAILRFLLAGQMPEQIFEILGTMLGKSTPQKPEHHWIRAAHQSLLGVSTRHRSQPFPIAHCRGSEPKQGQRQPGHPPGTDGLTTPRALLALSGHVSSADRCLLSE